MTCKYCGAETKWPEPYVQGALMINADGSEHRCKGKSQEVKVDTTQTTIEKPVEQKGLQTHPQAKDFAKIVDQQLFDDGYARAIRKRSLLLGIRKALPTEDVFVIGMIFKEICADLRL